MEKQIVPLKESVNPSAVIKPIADEIAKLTKVKSACEALFKNMDAVLSDLADIGDLEPVSSKDVVKAEMGATDLSKSVDSGDEAIIELVFKEKFTNNDMRYETPVSGGMVYWEIVADSKTLSFYVLKIK